LDRREVEMASRRQSVSDFYRRGLGPLEKSAASADRYAFRGPAAEITAVVRTDLNGYSTWARDRDVKARAELLSGFFSAAVPLLEASGGVYYRDEGDCIVALFSSYFSPGATKASVLGYCKAITSMDFGIHKLTPKTCVSVGDVTFYQKAHEAGSDDWSAEGEPFVRAARLEAAVDSKQKVYFYQNEYEANFDTVGPVAQAGEMYFWLERPESLQVAGLGFPGGWVNTVELEYIPDGRIARRSA
jgi:hypothetical protein